MLLMAHSGFRYLVLLTGVIVIGYAAYGMVKKQPYTPRMRGLAALFLASLDLTVLLGLANIFFGSFYPQLAGHLTMMVLATAIAHIVSVVQRRRPPDQRTYAPHLVGTLIVLVVIAFGILAIDRPIIG